MNQIMKRQGNEKGSGSGSSCCAARHYELRVQQYWNFLQRTIIRSSIKMSSKTKPRTLQVLEPDWIIPVNS